MNNQPTSRERFPTTYPNIKTTNRQKEQVKALGKYRNIPYADIVRDAIDQYLSELSGEELAVINSVEVD